MAQLTMNEALGLHFFLKTGSPLATNVNDFLYHHKNSGSSAPTQIFSYFLGAVTSAPFNLDPSKIVRANFEPLWFQNNAIQYPFSVSGIGQAVANNGPDAAPVQNDIWARFSRVQPLGGAYGLLFLLTSKSKLANDINSLLADGTKSLADVTNYVITTLMAAPFYFTSTSLTQLPTLWANGDQKAAYLNQDVTTAVAALDPPITEYDDPPCPDAGDQTAIWNSLLA